MVWFSIVVVFNVSVNGNSGGGGGVRCCSSLGNVDNVFLFRRGNDARALARMQGQVKVGELLEC